MTIIEEYNFIIVNNTFFNIKIKTNVIDPYLKKCSLILAILKPNESKKINIQLFNFLNILEDYIIDCLEKIDKIPIFYIKYDFNKIYIENY